MYSGIVCVSPGMLPAIMIVAPNSPRLRANASTAPAITPRFASAAFVPVATMPWWIRGFARDQPITPVVDSLRALLLGTPAGSAPWTALIWCGGLLAAAAAAAGVLFRRRTA